MDDEYILDTPAVRAFVAQVRAELAAAAPQDALETLRPAFAALLADRHWLPEAYRQPAAESGKGSGIAPWLFFRAAGGELSLFTLVVPPGSATPVHDHLAWGLVGLYAGEQDEHVYRRADAGAGEAPLELVEHNHLHPGDFYLLMPPEGDIHSVATLSDEPSVSIHLLGNDTGCVWRHAYTPDDGGVRAFRSGWSNVECHNPAL
jgi:predicted metal-dependent enzyme (double-stranded beta helix superfamily)